MRTQADLKLAIMNASKENAEPEQRLHKCNFCKRLNEDNGICSVYLKEVPATFCGKINKCKQWSVIKFDDPIPF
jgi:hypothetical protein